MTDSSKRLYSVFMVETKSRGIILVKNINAWLCFQITAFPQIQTMSARQNNAKLFGFFSLQPPFPFFLSSSVSTEMTGEVHICSLQVLVGVQIEAMIYDMCCKQSLCISQGPVTAPAQAVKGSVIRSLILHLGHNSPERMQVFVHTHLLIW